MSRENTIDRRERLKGEGKVELPLNIDTRKYLFANISFNDVFVVSPILIISIIIIFTLFKTGNLSTVTAIVAITPTVFIGAFQIIKHPIRKNLSFLKFRVLWKLQYNKRQKDFFYTKGEIDMANETDVRKKLGIKNIFSGCYETPDNRFVKVLEVSSLNLSLMNRGEAQSIKEGYRTFINENQLVKNLQISVVAQPINLSRYMLHVEEETSKETNPAKRMLAASYTDFVEDIQRNRNMVARKRYIVIDHPIGNDREKALEEIERNATIILTKIENMLTGHSKLNAKILSNDELMSLLYTCLDYDNAQSLGEHIVDRANNKMDITLGETSARDIISQFEKQLKNSIN